MSLQDPLRSSAPQSANNQLPLVNQTERPQAVNLKEKFLNESPLERMGTWKKILYALPFGLPLLYTWYKSGKQRSLAMEQYNKGKFDEAIEIAHPLDKWRFQLAQGIDELGKGNPKQALTSLEKAQKVHKDIFEVNFVKGNAELRNGNLSTAYNDFVAAHQSTKNSKDQEAALEKQDKVIINLERKYSTEPKLIEFDQVQLKKAAADLELLVSKNLPNHQSYVNMLKELYLIGAETLFHHFTVEASKSIPDVHGIRSTNAQLDQDGIRKWMEKFENLVNSQPKKQLEDILVLQRCYAHKDAYRVPLNKPSYVGSLTRLDEREQRLEKYLHYLSEAEKLIRTPEDFLAFRKSIDGAERGIEALAAKSTKFTHLFSKKYYQDELDKLPPMTPEEMTPAEQKRRKYLSDKLGDQYVKQLSKDDEFI